MKHGFFITLVGNDGAGKTTVALGFKEALEKRGYKVVYTREPGGSKIAERIRDILLNDTQEAMDGRTEALLFAASRRQHLKQIVMPALEENKIVLCDRFVDSSLAYQGVARGLGLEEVWKINQFAIENCMPQLTLFLKVSIETGQKRMNIRGEKNRLDREQDTFHQKVREGYDLLIRKFPERIKVIDAEPDPQTVLEDCIQTVLEGMEAHG